MTDAEDVLGEALGADVRVRRAGDGVKAELRFDDLGEVASLARRLRTPQLESREVPGRLAQLVRARL